MKKLLFLIPAVAILIFSGCYNRHALDRRPQPPKKQFLQHKQQKESGELFDSVFHNKQQRFENSSLSEQEKKMIENNDSRNDREIRKIRDKNRNSKNQDWVFGTGNGSIF